MIEFGVLKVDYDEAMVGFSGGKNQFKLFNNVREAFWSLAKTEWKQVGNCPMETKAIGGSTFVTKIEYYYERTIS